MVSGSKRVGRLRARNRVEADSRQAVATKAVAYIRVSTDEQAESGHGLETQERAVRAFAESQGYQLVEIASDPGVSGATRPADRPGFGRVLELAAAEAFTVLLVYRFDRLAREIRYAVTTVSDLAEAHQVVIRSVTEPIDTATAMGRTIFAILAGMAENERFVIRDRTAGGRLQKARKGGFAGGRAPYGYERHQVGDARGLRIVPAQAKVVRRIYALKERKWTLQRIADALNAEAIPSPNGKQWRPDRVAYIADNPKYRGLVEYLFRYGADEDHVLQPGQHDPIIKQFDVVDQS